MTGKMKFNRAGACEYSGIIVLSIILVTAIVFAGDVQAQNAQPAKAENKTPRFIDEDGDGFNDLLPDADGDGIPNLIDPDFKGHSAESLYMYRYRQGQTIDDERNRFQHMYQHGEPGQYGPADSTGHGQRNEGQGGHHGGGPGPGGGMPGMSAPDSARTGHSTNSPSNQNRGDDRQIKENENNRPANEDGIRRGADRDPEKEKGSGNRGGRGGRP